MRKLTSGVGEFVAFGLAAFTVIAAVVLIIFYGKVDVVAPGRYGGTQVAETVLNWPLIVSSVVGAIYSVLFAVLFAYVETARNTIVDIANHMDIKPGQQ